MDSVAQIRSVAAGGELIEEAHPFHDPRMPTLPFKLNQDRRPHTPKQKRKTTNTATRAACSILWHPLI